MNPDTFANDLLALRRPQAVPDHPEPLPIVEGRCPACGYRGLVLDAGRVRCAWVSTPARTCPAPHMAHALLELQPTERLTDEAGDVVALVFALDAAAYDRTEIE